MQAFAALKAERRWVATGTPIVNSPGQLHIACTWWLQADIIQAILGLCSLA